MTDAEVETEITETELMTFLDAIAIVNHITGYKEDWFVQEEDGGCMIPVLKKATF